MTMHVLITAGGTREYIDPVRFISNASSGKMGYALARAALRAGHRVTLITAPVALKPPVAAEVVPVESAAQMFEAVRKHFTHCDCLIMAAAVADYTPVRTAKTKIKKSPQSFNLKLKRTKDILRWAGRNKHAHQIVVGFALEDADLRDRAEKKLRSKNLDMIVANEPSAIGVRTSTVHVRAAGREWIEIPHSAKQTIARRIISQIETMRENN